MLDRFRIRPWVRSLNGVGFWGSGVEGFGFRVKLPVLRALSSANLDRVL